MVSLPMNDRDEEDRAISLLARDQYTREVAWGEASQPLEREEEGHLLRRLLRAKCEPENAHVQMLARHARERLVEGYQPLMMVLARRASRRFRAMEFLDLVNEANIGLLQAIDSYTEQYPSFEVMVRVCVRQTFWRVRYGSDQWVHIPCELRKVLSQMRRFAAQWDQKYYEQPSVSEYALHLGVNEALVEDALCVDTFERIGSLQVLPDEIEDYQSLTNLFDDPSSLNDEGHSQLRQVFEQAMERELTPTQRQVVEYRYGFGESAGLCRTQKQVAELLGVRVTAAQTHERVAKQRLSKALVPVKVGSEVTCAFRSGYQEEYYTVSEAASVLGVSRTSVWHYFSEGRLPVERHRRGNVKVLVPKQAVHELAARRSQEEAA